MTEDNKIVLMASSAHLLTHAYMMIFPTVLVLIANDTALGVTEYFQLGTIGTLCYALFGIGAIPSGILADRYGSKKMLSACLLISGLASVGAGLSYSVYPFVIAMMSLGLGASMYHPSGLSFISRNVQQKGKAMGCHGVGGNIGLAIGPVVSGAAGAVWGWRSAFLIFGIAGVLLGMMVLRSSAQDQMIPPHQAKPSHEPEGPSPAVLPVLILFMVYGTSIMYGLVYRGTMMYFPKHFVHNIGFAAGDVAKAGLLVSMVSLVGILGQLWGGTLCDKLKRPEYVYLMVFVFTTPLFFAIWLLRDWALLRVSLVFAPFFFAWQPIQNTLIAKYSVHKAHGISYGANFLLIMGVGSLAASFGGFITDHIGVAYVFASLGIISAVALVFVFTLLRKMAVRYGG
jgi:predicted MFS family arabinose efflux permease